MSYEPLHHKYRPQTFSQLVGQGAIATTLTRAIQTQRIAPAYLFTGPRGTGKTSSARILAKSLNCLSLAEPTPQPCGTCEVCRAITKGSALDVIEIDAASNTGVDNIRELIERAQFAPVQCRYKVYVVDEVHMLSNAAFNALLKTLEEPPERVVFVLATTDPQRVLPTIISRCQRFDFRRIALAEMVSHLKAIATQEQIEITDEAISLVGQLANGGLRDAESLLDQLGLLPSPVTVEQVWDLVGAVPEQDLLILLNAIAHKNAESLLTQCRQLLNRGREPLVVLQNLAGFYRDLLIAKTAPQRQDLVTLTPSTWEQLCEQAGQWTLAQILHGQQHLKESEGQIKNTTQPRLWLEVALCGLLAPETVVTPSQAPIPLQASVQSLSPAPSAPPKTVSTPPASQPEAQPAVVQSPPASQPEAQPVVVQSPPASQPEAQPAVVQSPPPSQEERRIPQQTPLEDNTYIEQRTQQVWQKVLHILQPPTTQALVRQRCHLVSLDLETGFATIGISSQPLLKIAEGSLPNIETAFESACAQRVKVKLVVGKTSEAQIPPPPPKTHPPQQTMSPAPTKPPVTYPAEPSRELREESNITKVDTPVPTLIPETESTPTVVPTIPEEDNIEDSTEKVEQAAKTIADFFKGEVIPLQDDFRFSFATSTAIEERPDALETELLNDEDEFDF